MLKPNRPAQGVDATTGADRRMFQVVAARIADVRILTPQRFGDPRGFFSETYNRRALAECGLELEFVQDNHSYSRERGTVRGLHYQVPPRAQHKLIRVARGAILDVAVDLRRGSPTFGQHVAAIVSADLWNQLLVPVGFAHGFCTLTPDTDVIYKVTDYHSPAHERGILWNDPQLGIDWPVASPDATVSARDQQHPRWADVTDFFA